MQIVEVGDSEAKPHCPRCGKSALDKDGEVKACKHLVFVGSSVTGLEPWYEASVEGGEKEGGNEEGDNDEDEDEDYENVVEMLKAKFPGSEFMMFLVFAPAPAALEVYVVYRLTSAS